MPRGVPVRRRAEPPAATRQGGDPRRSAVAAERRYLERPPAERLPPRAEPPRALARPGADPIGELVPLRGERLDLLVDLDAGRGCLLAAGEPGAAILAGMFDPLASLLMPIDDGVEGVAVEAGADWSLGGVPPGADVVVWGRGPWGAATPARTLARSAVARERALRRLERGAAPLPVLAIHRWPPPEFRIATAWRRARAALQGGAIVELGRPSTRPIDLCARAAGTEERIASIRPVTAGGAMATITVEGAPRLLKVSREGGPGDPLRAGEALERLAAAGVTLAPTPYGRGRIAGAVWNTESIVSGRRPPRVSPEIQEEARAFAEQLPLRNGPPATPPRDLDVIARAFPWASATVESVTRWLAEAFEDLPAVMCHGDFWSGNVLAEGASLRGVIDWDAWQEAGVPGTDLLHFLATERGVEQRRQLGEIWRTRPWASEEFRTWSAPYWGRLGIRADEDLLEAVGAAWWAGRVAYRLGVRPELATESAWLERTIEPVIETLASRVAGSGGPLPRT